MRTGLATLPLHSGRAPRWLFERMVELAREIACHVVAEYGPHELLRRLSDPFWFQAFGCVLGFDWHSSGLTTSACGALKEGIKGLERYLQFFAAGGKGAVARRTPGEITRFCERLGAGPEPLVYASRMAAKVDSAALQDGYTLYHHVFFFSADGQWCVVQQGMRDFDQTARRYHWLGEKMPSFVNEPHSAVCCDRKDEILNLVAQESATTRGAIAEIVREPFAETLAVLDKTQELILPHRHQIEASDINPSHLRKVLLATYERAPEDFEALLGIRGVGPKALRALTLVSELIYGTKASTRDPARFSFAHGGKDRTPYPVDRTTYDKTIDVLRGAVNRAQIGRSEKIAALKRLAGFSGETPEIAPG
jgi:hypothetical protein